MLKFIYVTGGTSKLKGFSERISRELRMLSDYRDPINIVHKYSEKEDPSLDAWKGASKFANDKFSEEKIHKYMVTKKIYDECGHAYI